MWQIISKALHMLFSLIVGAFGPLLLVVIPDLVRNGTFHLVCVVLCIITLGWYVTTNFDASRKYVLWTLALNVFILAALLLPVVMTSFAQRVFGPDTGWQDMVVLALTLVPLSTFMTAFVCMILDVFEVTDWLLE